MEEESILSCMNTPLKNPLPIDGVYTQTLTPYADERGSLTELYRSAWTTDPMIQWNYVQSKADVLRGMHMHIRHTDCVVALSGSMLVNLKDLRPYSPTYGQIAQITLTGPDRFLVIPPGVAHGFYCPEATLFMFAVSDYFDQGDEFGCHYQDADLAVSWPVTDATIVSPRDLKLPSLAAMLEQTLPLLEDTRVS